MANTTAVSTLVLALEARNNSAAAFAELRGQLREQVEAAQQAARQSAEAARTAQAEQLLALRQTTAQELLELRQRTAAEAQQIRQAAQGGTVAQRQAAQDQILMRRQDAEQQALVMRQSAEQQAAAIRSTTDAQIQASREQLEAVEQAARAEAEAMRLSQSQQAAAAREAAVQERTSAREREGGGGLPFLGGLGELGGGLLRSAGTMALWTIGYQAINAATQAMGGFAEGLVTANSRMEQFNQSFAVLMGSQAGGAAATAWLTQFALKAPATLDQVMQAGETVATLGDNMKAVMPAIGNVAAAMGVDLPRAAQAFADAQMGRFEMLQMTLHVTKDELVKYGLQLDASGHVLNNSFVPAFERLAQARFGQGMTMQMDTVAGVFSNVQDALENLQRIMGKPMFALIRKDLEDFMKLLQSPQAQIVAHAIGEGLGHAFHAMSDAARAAAPVVWNAINLIVGAWNLAQPAIETTITIIKGTMGAIGTFLAHVVLPVVYTALGQMVVWWGENAGKMQAVINFIKGVLGGFGKDAGSWMTATLSVLQGIWEVGWGALSGVVSIVLDTITGNWSKLGPDLNHMTTQIALGVSDILKGLVENAILILSSLKEPLNNLMHGLYDATKPFADAVFGLFTIMKVGVLQSINDMIGGLNSWVDKINSFHINLPGGKTLSFHAKHIGEIAMPTAGDVRKQQQQWENTLSLGWRPDVSLQFGKSPKQAIADVEKWWKENVHDPIARTDTFVPSKKGTPDFGKLGQETLKGWLDALQKAGGLLHMGKDMPKWLKDLLAGLGSWSGGGTQGQGFDVRSASEAQQKAIQAAETRFQIDLLSGHLTQQAGMRDIRGILASERAAGATKDQLTLTLLQDTKTLDEQLLGQAQKHFDFDAGVAHPSRLKLHQDELAYLKILAQTPGITPLDIATQRQQMDARITQIMGGKAGVPTAPIAPVPRYGALAGQTGYGGVTVSFGGAQVDRTAEIIAELRQSNRYWQQRAERDERVITLLEGGNTIGSGILTGIRSIDHLIGHPPPPAPARSAHSILKAAGSYAPVTR